MFVYSAAGLQRLAAVRGQHAWYVTEMAWAQDSHAVLSVSGGASALVTPVRQRDGGSTGLLLLLLALLALALAVAAKMLVPGLPF